MLSRPFVPTNSTSLTTCNTNFMLLTMSKQGSVSSLSMLKSLRFPFDSFLEAYVHDLYFGEVCENISLSRFKYEGLDDLHL